MTNGGEEFSCNGLIPVKSSCIGIIPVKEQGPGGHVFPSRSSLRAVFTCISVRYQVQNIFVNCSRVHIKKRNHAKTNSLFNHLNSSRALRLSWKLCDLGSRGTRFEFHRGQLFISVSLSFSQSEDSKTFQSLSLERRWPPHMRASEVYKNLPAGVYMV